MLKLAIFYEDKLKIEFGNVALDERFMFMRSSSYSDVYKASASTWNEMQMVSVDKDNNIIGYLEYSISRVSDRAYSVQIVNFRSFDENPCKATFGRDVNKFFKDVFDKYQHRKLSYSCFIGNPIEATYDKLTKIYGGRIVGIEKAQNKLLDGNFYDLKGYEIMRSDYDKTKK